MASAGRGSVALSDLGLAGIGTLLQCRSLARRGWCRLVSSSVCGSRRGAFSGWARIRLVGPLRMLTVRTAAGTARQLLSRCSPCRRVLCGCSPALVAGFDQRLDRDCGDGPYLGWAGVEESKILRRQVAFFADPWCVHQ